jgi:ElaA protein
MEWELKRFDELTVDELYGILKLRSEVFVVEQNCIYQDLDGKDNLSYHLFLKNNGEIIAVLRIIPEGISYEEMSIGRVVVKKTHRGKGISKSMMNKAIKFITDDLNKNRIRLSGQAYLTDFYEGLGFKKVSDIYLEDGIDHFEFLYDVGF